MYNFRTLYSAYLIGPNGTEVVKQERYNGDSENMARDAYRVAVESLERSWHFFSPRDRVTVSIEQDGKVILTRSFGP